MATLEELGVFNREGMKVLSRAVPEGRKSGTTLEAAECHWNANFIEIGTALLNGSQPSVTQIWSGSTCHSL